MKTNGKRRKPEQIVRLLRKAEADINAGFTPEDVCRDLDIAVSTLHRWRKQYGGMAPDDAKRLKTLEDSVSSI